MLSSSSGAMPTTLAFIHTSSLEAFVLVKFVLLRPVQSPNSGLGDGSAYRGCGQAFSQEDEENEPQYTGRLGVP